ncbi:MAG: hydroxymethylglutaryl-CoA reductase, degradative [Candidatus Altiarchaeales archaeon]|nr:MAG: hydroxymethylglutaryl-CoA reductase, degradative [Candidatus Altiarchaeales archaeon]
MHTKRDSRISGFYKLSIEERIQKVKEFASLDDKDIAPLRRGISIEDADRMVENVIGKFEMPFGIAVNFRINDRDYLVPMVTEESSVIAAASNAAKIAREGNGFRTSSTEPIMIGQVQIIAKDLREAEEIILKNKGRILDIANKQDPILIKLGGGAKRIETRIIKDMLILHIFVDVRDAMGANAVNTMCEAVGEYIEKITNGDVNLRIISNFATERIAKAEVKIPLNIIGKKTADRIILAYKFANNDIYRAVTHNKGIMNGITAVAIATGNDTRAIEAGAHAYAARNGVYKPLTEWKKNGKYLTGRIEIPLAVGIVGGGTIHPLAKLSLKILDVKTAGELSEVMAAVGLAQNFAALRALVSEGIQRGHMKLHAKNIAMIAGAKGKQIDIIAEQLIKENNINVNRARELLVNLKI